MYIVINIVKTYACKNAIRISRLNTTVTMSQGMVDTIFILIFFAHINVQLNPLSIFSKACPDSMFANKRIPKLKTRAKYEINSMMISIITKATGTPLGKNADIIDHPLLYTINILIAIK